MDRLVVECDPGVDDCLALLMLAAAGTKLDLIISPGNVSVDHGAATAAWLGSIIGPAIQVLGTSPPTDVQKYAYAVHGELGAGWHRPAPLETCPSPVAAEHVAGRPDYLCLSPAIAVAHLIDSRCLASTNVILMGGSISNRGNVTPTAEFNFWSESKAAAKALGHGSSCRSLSLVDLDCALSLQLSVAELVSIADSGKGVVSDLIMFILDNLDEWDADPGHACLADPVAALMFLRPDLFETVRYKFQGIEHDGPRHGSLNAQVATGGDEHGSFLAVKPRNPHVARLELVRLLQRASSYGAF